MKPKYRLFKRGEIFYVEEAETGRQHSLQTKDQQEALKLMLAKNEASNFVKVHVQVAKAYLAAVDPLMLTRTWTVAMNELEKRGTASTQDRYRRAMAIPGFDGIRHQPIIETTAADFLSVLSDGKQSTSHYLKLLHRLALDLGWLAGKPILPQRCWPKVQKQPRRAISHEEHQRIVAGESNVERRLYYELLWETGASQSDAASLSAEDINLADLVIVYHRKKTGTRSALRIGQHLSKVLEQLPRTGPLFPILKSWDSTRRSAEFYRRCKIVEVIGVSLHSYRYAWAERAYTVGYPERFAQAALGHESKAVHRAYARGAKVNCPALDGYGDDTPPV